MPKERYTTMKTLQLILIAIVSVFTTGCFTKQIKQEKVNYNNNIIITVKATHAQFHNAFSNLPKHAEGFFSFQGSVNGVATTLHFFHGSYAGFTLKNAPTTGMFVVCHAKYQPKHIQARAVLVAEGRTRLVLLSSTNTTLTFKVVEAKHKPFQKRLIQEEEQQHKDSMKDMGTISLR